MTSVLRQLQAEWNTLVPEAQARGIRRVRLLNAPLETIEYRRTRLEWLRAQLGVGTSLTTESAIDAGAIDTLTFGVELEIMMPAGMTASTLALRVSTAGVPCAEEGYNHQLRNNWKIVTDGSLGDYSRGREVVSPVLKGPAGFEQLRKVCKVLEDSGCKVSKKCGFHVHVGARAESVQFFKNLAVLYSSAEQAIDSFMAPSRRGANGGNGFCRSISIRAESMARATTIDAVTSAIGQTPGTASTRSGGRYCKLNFQSYWQHGTVEFRHHQGTVDAVKAETWVRLCLRMCVAARGAEKRAYTIDELMAAVEAPDSEKDFFHGRARFFARGTAGAAPVARPAPPVVTAAPVARPAPPVVTAAPVVAEDRTLQNRFLAQGDRAQVRPDRR